MSLRFTLKTMRKLVAAGIVRSFKGAKGGYQLARGPESVTLRQVIEAVEGPLPLQPLPGRGVRLFLFGGNGLPVPHGF